jgi:hypothetical protein
MSHEARESLGRVHERPSAGGSVPRVRFRSPLLARLTTAAAVLLVSVACAGEEASAPPGTNPDVAAAVCRLARAAGDSDCDRVIDYYDRAPNVDDWTYDHDGDGIPIALDRFEGDDLGDEDGDGFANRVDLDPRDPARTLDAPSAAATPSAAAEQQRNAILDAESKKLARQSTALDFVNQHLDRHDRDRDGDGASDIADDQPDLRWGDDYDGDGTVNGRDLFPHNDAYD